MIELLAVQAEVWTVINSVLFYINYMAFACMVVWCLSEGLILFGLVKREDDMTDDDERNHD